MKIFSYDIKFNTFFKKGLEKLDDRFGVWFVVGRQGTGKSYVGVYLLMLQNFKILNKVKTNIHSLKLKNNIKVEYFTKIEEIEKDTEEHCIYIIDEISRKYKKNTPTDTQFYAWLNQCRKRKRVVILITQEWRELPMWIRRPAKYCLSTKPCILLGHFGFYNTTISDAENMVFNKDEGEYECPPLKHYIYKRNKSIADLYDTFEPINDL